MCPREEDFQRTVALLRCLIQYRQLPGADREFLAVVGPSLAVSVPDFLPSGYDPTEGPEYPGQGW